ncbi:hypothetical protein OAQ84_00580 [Bdellovibrionales bacterium]|nr:hypothetical protein [Bdellovibrionales bacterium]
MGSSEREEAICSSALKIINLTILERELLRLEVELVLGSGFHEKRKNHFDDEFKSWDYSIRGQTVDGKKLHEAVLRALIFKSTRLSGAEIRFIRLFFEMTLKEFGEKFDVTHPAVKKWETAKFSATEMKWSIEKDIRLFALTGISKKAKDFLEAYKELEIKAKNKKLEIKIDLGEVA